ncbi:gliding motility-associated C-terminal domain-containing protein [Chitinophaga alhagiae]|uniref:T9SS type B sorting domain-containing protein n=1 Tax=Chitinophaga alhagiae TaxID=2203219 RepID=UPI000E5B7A38|nr:gliding motility-associated C-terminal domain-containing protein [Chitinophaga alhagiae]
MKPILYLCLLFPFRLLAQQPGFVAPDTVCVNTEISLQNTVAGAGSYFWNFCSGNVYNPPELQNLGNPGGLLNTPVHTVIAKDGNDYYVFLVNNTDQRLVKLAFGSSLLNAPSASYVPGVTITRSGEGIQLIEDADGFHLVIVGGTVAQGPAVMKVDFGASLSNPVPTVTNWGNIGNMAYPNDLFTFEEGGVFYGFTVNFENNTITRLRFGADLNATPTGVNLGSFGLLDRPAGLYAIKENGSWYVFVVNERSHKLVRLDFGTSLLNTPAAVDLGNAGGLLRHPRDITFVRECGQTIALVLNGSEPHVQPPVNKLVRLDFSGGITSNMVAEDLGNPGGILNFPVSLSAPFRVNNDLYAFVPNVTGNSLARVSFRSCTDASVPSSTNATPPAFSYARAGKYTVTLITDEGTPDQQNFCKTIVVKAPPVVDLGVDRSVCSGQEIALDAGDGFRAYSWSTGSQAQKISAGTTGTYSVTVSNGACTASDEVGLTFFPAFTVGAAVTPVDCNHPDGSAVLQVSGGTAPFSYALNGNTPVASGTFNALPVGDHSVLVTDVNGCAVTHPFAVTEDAASMLQTAYSKADPSCMGLADGAIELTVTQGVPPFEYALENSPFQADGNFTGLSDGAYKLYIRNGVCLDSQQVTLKSPLAITAVLTTENEVCSRGNGTAEIRLSGGTPPYTIRWNGNETNLPQWQSLGAGAYYVTVEDQNGCGETRDFHIGNVDIPRVNILNNDTTINIGEELVLQAENAPDYQWQPLDGWLSCLDCATPVARPLRETRYIVRTVTGQNCINADTVLVKVSYHRSFQMPNAFTPNGDGVNDFFRPVSKGVIVYNMQIYNRWGQLIYQGTQPKTGWDGKLNGVPQEAGTYVYFIQYGFWGNEGDVQLNSKKGTFTLLR